MQDRTETAGHHGEILTVVTKVRQKDSKEKNIDKKYITCQLRKTDKF